MSALHTTPRIVDAGLLAVANCTATRVARPILRPAFLGNTAIVGVGYTELTKASGRSVLSLATEACDRALEDAGLTAQPTSTASAASASSRTRCPRRPSPPRWACREQLAARPQPRRSGTVLPRDPSRDGRAPRARATPSSCTERSTGVAARASAPTVRPGPATDFRYPLGLTAYVHYISTVGAPVPHRDRPDRRGSRRTSRWQQRECAEQNERAYLRGTALGGSAPRGAVRGRAVPRARLHDRGRRRVRAS